MALKYKATKLDERVLSCISADVEGGIFKSANNAINSILKKHYKIKNKNENGKNEPKKKRS